MRRTTAAVALASLASCGSTGAGTSGGSVANTPRGVTGAAIADLARGDYAALCTFLLLGQGQRCNTGAPNTFTVTGYSLGNSVTSGSRALVTIEADRACIFQSSCSSNHDSNAGLPQGSLTFDEAWQSAISGGSFFTTALEKSGEVWKVVALLKRG